MRKYPEFKKYKRNKLDVNEKQISIFVNSIYQKNNKIIRKNLDLYKKSWAKLGKDYFVLVSQIFGDYKWPLGKYIVYLTIWGMHPRFLEDKTFQIPFRHKNEKYINVIIAHEMLHFIFYDYFYNKFPQYKSNKYNFFVWNISEIFNNIAQDSPQWIKIFKAKSMPYPEHKKIVNKLKKKFYKKSVIIAKDLIKEIIKNKDFLPIFAGLTFGVRYAYINIIKG